MDHKLSSSLILLTYKNKALLLYRQESPIDGNRGAWSLIETTTNKDTFQDAFKKTIEAEMGIKIGNIHRLSEFCYQAYLTDENVNQIKRSEGHLLDFFTLKDLSRILLSKSTAAFVSRYGSLI